MRNFIHLLAFLLASALAAAAEPGVSLLPNGNFALDSKGAGWPDGWSHPAGSSWQKEGDTHFLRLQTSGTGQMILVYGQMAIPSPAPPAFEIRVSARYSDIKPGSKSWFDARIMGHFKDAAGKQLRPDPAVINFRGSSKGWVERSVFVKVPAGATLLELMPTMFRPDSGTWDLAKIEVLPATADQLPKPPPMIPSQTMVPANPASLPPELHVAGNQLQTKEGKVVWLQGLCLDSMEWSAGGEHILQSIPVATEQWKANVIRLPVKNNFWFGRGPWQKKGSGGLPYRKLVDDAVNLAASHGAYLVLDLHRFGAPMAQDIDFWKDAAIRYKNNPAVLFELFNEPHSISWKAWRDGGSLSDPANRSTDANAAENKEQQEGEVSTGMQALVNAIRATGARNLLIAGGLDWGYDLSGLKDYALHDSADGDGIMYSSHIYPWKKDWQIHTLDAAAKYPIFLGEVGTPPDWSSAKFIPVNEQYEDLSKKEWAPDVIGLIQKYKLNWTGFSFHPKCMPMAILDWNYTPTPYWGVFVKEALAGQQFEMKRMR